jgi:hypothetical protein
MFVAIGDVEFAAGAASAPVNDFDVAVGWLQVSPNDLMLTVHFAA